MNPGMIKKIKKMQDDMVKAQEALDSKEYFGKASGVTIIMLGTKQILDVQINDEMLEEKEILQDAILLATNDALRQINEEHEEVMGGFTGGLPGFGF